MTDIQILIDFLRPSKDRPGALYKQLSTSLKSAIEKELLAPNDALLPERILAEKLNISRTIVRMAIDELVAAGLLSKQQGSGTIVVDNSELMLHKTLASLNNFSADMKRRGLEFSSRITSREESPATKKEASILGLEEGDFVHRLNRVRLVSGEPIAYEIATVPASVISIETELRSSLYESLRDQNMCPVMARQSIRALNADEDTAQKLGILPNSAVLFIERRGYIKDGNMVEYTQSYYRGDRYDYTVELK